MPEPSLTQWLDPLFEYFAKESGIPIDQYTAVAGGQGLGATEEVICDLFLQGVAGKIVQFATGLGATLYGIFGKDNQRLKRELITWGQHSLTRVIDPKPSDIIEVRQNINDLVSGLQLGDAGKITNALIRSPTELATMLSALGTPMATKVSAPVTPTTPTTPTVPTAAVKPTVKVYA